MLIPDSPPSHCLPGPSVNYIVYLLADITSHAPISPNRNFSHMYHCSLPSLIPGWTSLYLPFLYNLFPHQGTLKIQAKSGHCLNPERLPSHYTQNKSQSHPVNSRSLVYQSYSCPRSCFSGSPIIYLLHLHRPL